MAKEKPTVDHWEWDSVESCYVAKPTFKRFDEVHHGYFELDFNNYGEVTAKEITLKEDNFVNFQEGPLPEVLTEVDKFWTSSHKYKRLGCAHKRSILCYGDPGCGKSMIMVAVIRHVVENKGIAIKMDNPYRFSEKLAIVRQIQTDTPIVVICEDLDDLIDDDEETMGEILDGTSSMGQGILYISTTNYLDKIPPRFKNRPSRIDTLIQIPTPSEAQRMEYIRALLRNEDGTDDYTPEYAKLAAESLSLADMKEGVISSYVFEKSMDETIARLRGNVPRKKKNKVLREEFLQGYKIIGNEIAAIAVNVKEPQHSRTFEPDVERGVGAYAVALAWASVEGAETQVAV